MQYVIRKLYRCNPELYTMQYVYNEAKVAGILQFGVACSIIYYVYIHIYIYICMYVCIYT